MQTVKIRLGISSCLLGNKVRFDGGHKHNDYITATLGQYFEFVPFCPETEAGLGIPRPPIHLVKQAGVIRLLNVRDHQLDVTATLTASSGQIAERLDGEGLCGFILKKDSPSCGMERVKTYIADTPNAPPERSGTGIFAASIKQRHPNLPLEEEGRLCDPVLRENFITRDCIYPRWLDLLGSGLTASKLVAFHADHKYILMAHHQDGLRELGQLVAQAGNGDLTTLQQEYINRLMQVVAHKASRGQHANVLSHLMGYLHDQIDRADREELTETIRHYQQGYLPLIVPITLLKHHFRRHPHPYIDRQHYLTPHPGELMLRNEV